MYYTAGAASWVVCSSSGPLFTRVNMAAVTSSVMFAAFLSLPVLYSYWLTNYKMTSVCLAVYDLSCARKFYLRPKLMWSYSESIVVISCVLFLHDTGSDFSNSKSRMSDFHEILHGWLFSILASVIMKVNVSLKFICFMRDPSDTAVTKHVRSMSSYLGRVIALAGCVWIRVEVYTHLSHYVQTRWAGQSPTWGRPAPQFRAQNSQNSSRGNGSRPTAQRWLAGGAAQRPMCCAASQSPLRSRPILPLPI